MRQAEWVRQCIAQRQDTMIRVSGEILRCQNEFFIHGPNYLQPLTMAQVADELELHESTVSRAIDRKYLQCSWGVFPMAYFFQKKATARNTRAAAMTEENFTPMDVKRKIREIIADENPKKPYSDRILSEKLGEAGITISRHGREVSGGREYTGCKRQKKILKKRARGRIRLQVCTDSYSFRNGSIPVRTTPPIISTR